MVRVLESKKNLDYQTIAAEVSQALAVNALERDRLGGIPQEEIELLKKSGLLLLSVPQEYGGIGATWTETYKVVQTLSKADGSLGQLYTNHVTLAVLGEVIGRAGQAEKFYRLTSEQNLFWANALNGRDARLKITPDGNNYLVNGIKSFGTGVAIGDLNVIAAIREGVEAPIIFVLPKDRTGTTYNYDWHNMGQRRTVSGSYTFNNVSVAPEEILGPPLAPESAFPTLIFLVAQLSKTFVYLGIAEGALEAARKYTLTNTRPWMSSGVDKAANDPFILHHYGELWTELQAAIALAERAAQKIDRGWQKSIKLTFEERGEIAIAVSAAKAFAAKAGLEVTNRIFEVTGARATAERYGFDRYWRDLRTFTLHDPVDYKLRDVGNWLLNDIFPTPSQYS
ncbi:acyl-CoA dehydrogenase family protein [Myxosarcina sp. GI1]|uniref:acyl-CoA dehydrogenase family protein n=1 Tax=Myxosarcina sp. GI1 TaxID=1541065 RepID=UPI00055FBB6E|nr:acyl-CoA dehydrogenase family protein [Myxosarcina sp. GI1]